VENCFRVALIWEVTRASAPTPGEEVARQNFRVAVPVSGTVPFLFKVSVKSARPAQLDGPVNKLFTSEK
jgi:hypothetical protein